jgi:hypothetical protein
MYSSDNITMSEHKDAKSHQSSKIVWPMPSNHLIPATKKTTSTSTTETTCSNASQDISPTTSRASSTSQESIRSSWSCNSERRMKNSVDGPQRGNRATMNPQDVSTPDVDSFIEHIANFGRRPSTIKTASSQSTQEGGLKFDGGRTTYTPQYAARNHGEMVHTAFPPPKLRRAGINTTAKDYQDGMITQAVWQELSRQQSVNRKLSSRATKPSAKKDDSVTQFDAVSRAIRARRIKN